MVGPPCYKANQDEFSGLCSKEFSQTHNGLKPKKDSKTFLTKGRRLKRTPKEYE